MTEKNYALDINGVGVVFRQKIGMKAFASVPAIISKIAGATATAEDTVAFVQAVVETWGYDVRLRPEHGADKRAQAEVVENIIAFFDARPNGELEFFAVINHGMALFSERLEAVQTVTPK